MRLHSKQLPGRSQAAKANKKSSDNLVVGRIITIFRWCARLWDDNYVIYSGTTTTCLGERIKFEYLIPPSFDVTTPMEIGRLACQRGEEIEYTMSVSVPAGSDPWQTV